MTESLNEETVVRRARIGDAVGVSGLLTELGYPVSIAEAEECITRNTAVPETSVFVAQSGAQLVGLASFHRIPLFHAEGFVGRITSFVVTSSYRKHGVGRLLVAAVENFAWKHGCVRMEVTSGDHRADAHAFYGRVGYKVDCRRFIKKKNA